MSTSSVKYDLVGQVAKGANITRRTAATILQGLRPAKLALFRNNPEEFIRKVVQIVREQKATMIVDHIHYHLTDGTYDSDIFTASSKAEFDKAYQATKHVTDYVVSDSQGERNFAHDLDEANEVVVYAKLLGRSKFLPRRQLCPRLVSPCKGQRQAHFLHSGNQGLASIHAAQRYRKCQD